MISRSAATKSWFWSWSNAKRGLEWLFWSGKITTATRRSFERVYDLPERVLPAAILALPTPSDHDAHLELTRRAVRALGVANRRDIRDYFRTALADTDPCIAELVEAGELVPVRVDGLRDTYYVAAGRARPQDDVTTRPCSRRSIRSSGSGSVPMICSAFTTGSRSTRRRRMRKHGYYVLAVLAG